MIKSNIVIENLRVSIDTSEDEIINLAKKQLSKHGISYINSSIGIRKKSIDARHKENITYVCSVYCESESDYSEKKIKNITFHNVEEYVINRGTEKLNGEVYIVGFGPAGMFAALLLSRNGINPIIIEKGSDIDSRVKIVDDFYKNKKLDINTNIQFGSGGAGTFSDGKLVTRIGDKRTSFVLQKLFELGGPEEILWKAKPHVGTDILRKIVKNAENEIISNGGKIRFNTTVDFVGDNYVVINGKKEKCACVILAPGHSSRDLYYNLISNNFNITAKPFSVGLRVEHIQRDIDIAMYGNDSISSLIGHAEYQLSYRKGDRGVYSFCMCPGGEVVAATSEEFSVVTNGMSYHSRNQINSNSAIAVSVLPNDFSNSPIKAIEFQRDLEKKAFIAGGSNYNAPCQSMGSFFNGKKSYDSSYIIPSYMNGSVTASDFNTLFPNYISKMLKDGFTIFNSKIKGFSNDYVPLTGIETRTSSPVRIERNENYLAIGFNAVYPCGEGAGYAGGITSAAVDGLRVAEAILKRFK